MKHHTLLLDALTVMTESKMISLKSALEIAGQFSTDDELKNNIVLIVHSNRHIRHFKKSSCEIIRFIDLHTNEIRMQK